MQKAFTVAVGAVTALVGVVTGAVMVADDFQKAENQLQSQTGATADEMERLAQNMENVYRNNFGENIEDVAKVMGQVQSVTGLVGEELEKATESAFLMRDVFEYDTTESIRTVDTMMRNFGITADEAFNLLAQGAQAGLDKDGSLLASMNEYSVYFNEMGFTVEEMFNMIANGAEVGVYDIDYLGDAIKELGIRTKDQSTASAEAFEAIGLNADEMFAKFGEGSESANEAFFEVVEALKNIDDPLLQNQSAVALFGTKFEDLEADAIFAMTNVEGAIDSTKTALDDMNAIKYNDLGSAIEGIKRIIEVDLLVPLGEKVLPKIQEFIGYLNENMPDILAKAEEFLDDFVDVLIFLADNLDIIIPLIVGMTTAMTVLKASFAIKSLVDGLTASFAKYKLANEGATVSQWLLNAAQKASPILLVVSLIAGLVAALITLWHTNEDFRNAVTGIWEKVKVVIGGVVDGLVYFFTELVPNAFKGFIEFFKNIFVKDWSEQFGILGNYFNLFFDNIEVIIDTMKKAFQGIIDFLVGVFTGDWEKAWGGLSQYFTAIWEGIKGLAGNVLEYISGLLDDLLGGIQDVINGLLGIEEPKLSNASINSKGVKTSTSVQGFATGTKYSPDTFIAGEDGAELIVNAGGSRVFPADDTAQILNAMREPVPVPVSAKETINHTGTIRIEGYNNKGEYEEVVNIVIDEIKRELRV